MTYPNITNLYKYLFRFAVLECTILVFYETEGVRLLCHVSLTTSTEISENTWPISSAAAAAATQCGRAGGAKREEAQRFSRRGARPCGTGRWAVFAAGEAERPEPTGRRIGMSSLLGQAGKESACARPSTQADLGLVGRESCMGHYWGPSKRGLWKSNCNSWPEAGSESCEILSQRRRKFLFFHLFCWWCCLLDLTILLLRCQRKGSPMIDPNLGDAKS